MTLIFGGVSAQTLSQSALLGSVVEHPTVGCGGAVVQTPPSGTQFDLPALGMPAGAAAFYAEAARRHVTWASSMECTHTGLTHVMVPAPAGMENSGINNGYVSANWSGYQISNVAQYVQVGWTVPTVSKPNPAYASFNGGYYSSTWTGVGGGVGASPSAPLIQAGTAQQLLSGTQNYYFWYEIVGGQTDTRAETRITKAVKAGDVAGTIVIWTPVPNHLGWGTLTFGLCNFSVGTCTNVAIGNPDPTQPQTWTPTPGKSTEWIVEAPSFNGAVLPLPAFDHVTFVNACWTPNYTPTATCSSIRNGLYPSSISLSRYVFGSNQIIAAPDVLSSDGTGFTDFYLQPAKTGP